MNYRIQNGPVLYYNPKDIDALQIDDNAKMFYKLEKYKFQHEFRLIKDISDGNNVLHFNSIKNFAFNAEHMIFNS